MTKKIIPSDKPKWFYRNYEPHDYNRGFKDGQDVLKESGNRDLQPDQSRLLTVEESVKAYNAGYAEDVVAYLLTDEVRMRKANGNRAILKAQRDLTASTKDDEIKQVYEECGQEIKDMDAQCQARIEALIEEIERNTKGYRDRTVGNLLDSTFWANLKATHCKANPTLG
ncbi:hypothetical protein LCGC14_2712610 [marine sediment metagenome]|uniref:Uncharacterized protein n=1 Tax=marine sediment metagenome TaxID=412755 RepID=A0A0F9A070_9ZZZZ